MPRESQVSEIDIAPGVVRRSDRGLCVSGRRVTLYLIEDYLRDGWPPHLVRHALQLSEPEMTEVLDYLTANRADFDREYKEVVHQAASRESSWRERERERRERMIPKRRNFTAGQTAAWDRLNELKRQGKAA